MASFVVCEGDGESRLLKESKRGVGEGAWESHEAKGGQDDENVPN